MIANELRIGNYVKAQPFEGMITVFNNDKCVVKHKSGIIKYYINDLEPIPLTEEWLVKFGFTITQIGAYLNVKSINEPLYIFVNNNGCGICIENNDANFDDSEELSFHIKIQYVHQIQTLYFALTNEELTIKL